MTERRTLTLTQFWLGVAAIVIPLIWGASAMASNNAATNKAQDLRDDQLESRVSRVEATIDGLKQDSAATKTNVDWLRRWAEGRDK